MPVANTGVPVDVKVVMIVGKQTLVEFEQRLLWKCRIDTIMIRLGDVEVL